MSLMLRKMTQEILDDAGLESFHTQINEQKCLAIVGECGQTLVDIHGITFSKFTLTVAEREFATELLGNFITKHQAQLREFLKKSRAFKAKPEPKNKGENWRPSYGVFRIFDDVLTLAVTKDGIVKDIDDRDDFPKTRTTLSQFCKYSMNTKMTQQAMKEIKAYQKWLDEEAEVNDLKSKLSMCEI